MLHLRQTDLPLRGMSYNVVGAEQGNVPVSAFVVHAPPGKRVGLHVHPYDEVVFVIEGRARWAIDGRLVEAGPGDVLVVKAGEVHGFETVGADTLVQIDVHANPTFEQTAVDVPWPVVNGSERDQSVST